jgi:hypothetical protein
MSEANCSESGVAKRSVFDRFVMCLSEHMQEWVILYVVASYIAFVVADIFYFHIDMDDPYGPTMIAIGSFWIIFLRLVKVMKRRIGT